MRDLATRLEDWRDHGLLSQQQVEAIVAFESQHEGMPAPRRTVFAEAVGYVGAALAVGAVGMIVADVWGELTTTPRLVLVGLLTVLLGGSGLGLRQATRVPLQRLASVLLTSAVVGVSWFAVIVAGEVATLRGGELALAGGGAALVAALPLYLVRRRALHQLTLLVAVVVVAMAALSSAAIRPDPMWFAVVALGIGAAWFLLAAGGWLEPRTLGEVAGAVVVLLASQASAVGRWPWLLIAVGVVVAGGLVALAVLHDRMHHLVVGSIALFVLVPRLVFELFGDAIGAPAALLVIGLLLVLLAVGLGRARREVGGPRGLQEVSR